MKIITCLFYTGLSLVFATQGWAAEATSTHSTEMDVQSIMRSLPPSARSALQRGDVQSLTSTLSPDQIRTVSKELQQLKQVQNRMPRNGAHPARSAAVNASNTRNSTVQQRVNQLQAAAQPRSSVADQQQFQQRMQASNLAVQQANSQMRVNGSNPNEMMPNGMQSGDNSADPQSSSMNIPPARYQALQNITAQALPLTPREILMLRARYNQTQGAATRRFLTPPKATSSTQIVKVSPGAASPIIRLSQGFVTSLVFVDSTGAPWPIEAYDLGDPSAVNINWDRKSHIMMMQATTLYAYANIAIKLHNLDTPLVLTLIPGEHVVDYVATLRVQGRGPNAKPYVMSDSLSGKTDPILLGVLDGVAPVGSTPLRIEGGEAEAWASHGRIYLRTRMNVLSPGWVATLSSPDGTHAYEMPKTPAILVSRYGKFVELKVEGY